MQNWGTEFMNKDIAEVLVTEEQIRQRVKELGEQIRAKYGEKFGSEFFSEDETALGEKIIILVNGRRAEFLQGLRTPLSDTDHVQIFPIVAGG